VTIEQVRRAYETRPFRPFIMHLADGRDISVHHNEYIALSPSGRTVIVYEPDESFNIVDLLLVTDLEFTPNGRSRRRRA
jgi:hypothetical protein